MQEDAVEKTTEANSSQMAFSVIEEKEENITLKLESKGRGKSNIICSFCKKIGHHRDRCWSLHGYPNSRGRNFRGNRWIGHSNDNREGSKLIGDHSISYLANLL